MANPDPSVQFYRSYSAFTLLELVLVIIIMGIMAVSLASLTKTSIYGYIDGKDRNQLGQSAKWLAERIGRELTVSLPQSIRTQISGNYHCVEFISIVNASTYLDMPASGVVTQFNAVAFDLPSTPATWVAVMPVNTAAIYNTSAGVLGAVASLVASGSQVTVNLAGAGTDFSGRSPQNRFFLINQPSAFCLNSATGDLYRYSGYGFNLAQASPPAGASELVGQNLDAAGDAFHYLPGSLSSSALIKINFVSQNRSRNLTGSEESFQVFHEVHIDNAP